MALFASSQPQRASERLHTDICTVLYIILLSFPFPGREKEHTQHKTRGYKPLGRRDEHLKTLENKYMELLKRFLCIIYTGTCFFLSPLLQYYTFLSDLYNDHKVVSQRASLPFPWRDRLHCKQSATRCNSITDDQNTTKNFRSRLAQVLKSDDGSRNWVSMAPGPLTAGNVTLTDAEKEKAGIFSEKILFLFFFSLVLPDLVTHKCRHALKQTHCISPNPFPPPKSVA